ncbi:unnamed protein product [Rodentolepis nana]|uniref:FH2 domain-containing protein n=2 Tax=Rodentolepis nana TaxID=102285 RepID=A0A0R3TWZ2_RODNA|nr:unnamed protein product [Rodentolepis nana]
MLCFEKLNEESNASLNPSPTKISAVNLASFNLKKSEKFKRLLELILAFGNYMNSCRRGVAYGFRLQSLEIIDSGVNLIHSSRVTTECFYVVTKLVSRKAFATTILFSTTKILKSLNLIPHLLCRMKLLLDTKTPDKQTTLLHFLVETVEEKFPELANFYDELDGITAASRGELIDAKAT